jgi:hydrogenase maturation protease
MSARPGKLRGGSYVFDFEDNVEGSISELAGFRFRNIVFMDSCEMGLEPGQVSVRPIADTSYPFFTTHGIPLRILAEQLLSGSQVWILAIQPKQTGFGESLSTEVRSTAIAISEFIATDLTDGGPAYAG